MRMPFGGMVGCMGKILLGSLAVVLLAGCAATPPPVPTATLPIPNEQSAGDVPFGFAGFCVRFPEQCRATPNGNQTLALDGQTWRLLNNVNDTVNGDIWPQSDETHYGRAEYWTIPTDGYGDCADYALTKRKELIAAGLPSQALRLAIVDAPNASRHAVLTVVTDKGDYVLDNLTNDIRAWHATGYQWLERQDGTNPMKWVSLLTVYADLRDGQTDGIKTTQLSDPISPTGEVVATADAGQLSRMMRAPAR